MKNSINELIKESKNIYILQYGNDFITYLSTCDFIISNNYCGLAACGKRSYDYNKKQVIIEYQVINDSIITRSNIIYLIKKYEKLLKTENIKIVELKPNDDNNWK